MPGQTGIRAGRAFVELYADAHKLTRGLRLAERRLTNFGNRVQGIGRTMALRSAAMLAPLAGSAKVFADFETQMANVSTMLDEPEKHMGRFTDEIRKMSIEFGESTEALAGGLYDILSASVAPEKALDVLTVAVKAATAGITDTKTAADAITTILNAYNLSAEHAGDVSDLLFSIVKRGKTTFGLLAPSIGKSASIASTANVSFEELGATIATMTRAGVQTENAMTAVNAIITSFLKPTSDAVDLARELGFEMNSATIRTEGLAGVMNRIKDLPPDAISKLFPNVRALKGVLPALKNLTGFADDLDAMSKRAGTTEVAYQKLAGTLTKSFNRVKQSGLAVVAVVGEHLAGALKKGSEYIVKISDKTIKFVKDNKKFVLMVAGIATAALAAGVSLVGVGIALKIAAFGLKTIYTPIKLATAIAAIFVKTLVALKAVLLALTVPLNAVLLGIAGIGAYYIYTSKASEGAINSLKNKMKDLVSETKKSLSAIAAAMQKGDIKLAGEILWNTFALLATKAFDTILIKYYELKRDLLVATAEIARAIADLFSVTKKKSKSTTRDMLTGAAVVVEYVASGFGKALTYPFGEAGKRERGRIGKERNEYFRQLLNWDAEKQSDAQRKYLDEIAKHTKRRDEKILNYTKTADEAIDKIQDEIDEKVKNLDALRNRALGPQQKTINEYIREGIHKGKMMWFGEPKPTLPLNPLQSIMDAITAAQKSLENVPDVVSGMSKLQQIGVKGTFSGYALEQIGAGRYQYEKEQVVQLKTVNEHLRELIHKGRVMWFD